MLIRSMKKQLCVNDGKKEVTEMGMQSCRKELENGQPRKMPPASAGSRDGQAFCMEG